MTRFICTTCFTTLWLCSFTQAAPPEAHLPGKHLTFLKSHCFDCHDSETQEGKVDLETLSFRITNIEQAELWQKVLNALNAGEMPPEDSLQPGNREKADFLEDLAQTMVAAPLGKKADLDLRLDDLWLFNGPGDLMTADGETCKPCRYLVHALWVSDLNEVTLRGRPLWKAD